MSVGPRAMRQPFLFHHIKKEKYDRCEGDGGGRPVAADLEMVRRWRLRKVVSNLTAARRSADEAADDHTGNCE